MTLEDYIREQEAKNKNAGAQSSRMAEQPQSSRDQSDDSHWRDGA